MLVAFGVYLLRRSKSLFVVLAGSRQTVISYQFSYRQRSSRSTARSDSVQHSVAARARRFHSPNWFAYLVPFSTSQLFRSRAFVYFSSLPLSCLDDIISTRDGCFLGRRNEAQMLFALVTPLPFGFALLHLICTRWIFVKYGL